MELLKFIVFVDLDALWIFVTRTCTSINLHYRGPMLVNKQSTFSCIVKFQGKTLSIPDPHEGNFLRPLTPLEIDSKLHTFL